MNSSITHKQAFISGFRMTIPIALGVFTYGVVYGIVSLNALTTGEAIASSMIVFAGVSQFIALGLWVQPLPAAALVFTVFIVNLRHMLMGASLYPYTAEEPPRRMYPMLFFMVDESWALAMRELMAGRTRPAFMFGGGVAVYVFWLAATVIGRFAGQFIPSPEALGIDFAMTAIFIVIIAGLFRGKKDIIPLAAALIAALLSAHFIPGKWYILAGGLAGSIAAWLRYDHE